MLIEWVQTYGCWAVLIGTLLEGETILLVGGFAAHRGYLSLPAVMLCAFCGSLVGDQTVFWIGRRGGLRLLSKWPSAARKIERVRPRLERLGSLLALTFRFFYGLRNVIPLAMAIAGFSPRKFAALNAVGAALWAILVGGMGFLFGTGLELLLTRAHRYQGYVVVLVAILGVAGWAVHYVRRRRSPSQAF